MSWKFKKSNIIFIGWVLFGQFLLIVLTNNENSKEIAQAIKVNVENILPGAKLNGYFPANKEDLSLLLPLMWVFTPVLLVILFLIKGNEIYPDKMIDRLPFALAVLLISSIVILFVPVAPTRITRLMFYSKYTSGIIFSCLTFMPIYLIRLVFLLPFFKGKV